MRPLKECCRRQNSFVTIQIISSRQKNCSTGTLHCSIRIVTWPQSLILTSAMNLLMSWVLGNQEGLQGLSSWTANFDLSTSLFPCHFHQDAGPMIPWFWCLRAMMLGGNETASRQHHGPQNSPMTTVSNLPGNQNLTGKIIELALFCRSSY
jgi:hypothetical protein